MMEVLTMDIYYFKDQLMEEIEGAKMYIKNAIEIKPMNASWGNTFYEMSIEEMRHATNIFKMAEEYYKIMSESYSEVPKYIQETYSSIVSGYSEGCSQVKIMQDMYK